MVENIYKKSGLCEHDNTHFELVTGGKFDRLIDY